MLREFGLQVPPYAVSSRNVAAVIVTADLPGAVREGDRFDVNVAALGDARSLAGGTLLMTPLANAVNESLFKNLRYKFGEHLAPVAAVAETANVLVVHPSLEAKSVSELTALAKARPGEILYATAGRGTATHLAGELFNLMAGTKLVPVHYKGGGQATTATLSGIAPPVGLYWGGNRCVTAMWMSSSSPLASLDCVHSNAPTAGRMSSASVFKAYAL